MHCQKTPKVDGFCYKNYTKYLDLDRIQSNGFGTMPTTDRDLRLNRLHPYSWKKKTRNPARPYLEGKDDRLSTAAFTYKSSGLTQRTVLHMAQTLCDHSPRIVKPWKLFGRAGSAFSWLELTLTLIFFFKLFRFWAITCEKIWVGFCRYMYIQYCTYCILY